MSIAKYRNVIHQGHSLEILPQLPENIVDMIVTSPPYWGLRNYETVPVDWKNWKGSLGLEPHPELYIYHLRQIFAACRKVLKPWGTLWVNLGDSSGGSGKGIGGINPSKESWTFGKEYRELVSRMGKCVPAKSLVLIPYRFALGMLEDGWICRNDIIWHKINKLPDPHKDRFTRDFEFVFLFTQSNKDQFWTNHHQPKANQFVLKQPPGIHGTEKLDWQWEIHNKCKGKGCKKCNQTGLIKKTLWTSHDYYFEQQFESFHPDSDVWYRQQLREGKKYKTKKPYKDNTPYATAKAQNPQDSKARILESMKTSRGRNKRAVWHIFDGSFDSFFQLMPAKQQKLLLQWAEKYIQTDSGSVWSLQTANFAGAHFAVYPPNLVKTPILAGCPEFVCKKCGYPIINQPKTKLTDTKGWGKATKDFQQNISGAQSMIREGKGRAGTTQILGYVQISCNCNAGFQPGIVLDPFFGSGSTGEAALLQFRDFLGIELNPNYIEIADNRLEPYLTQQTLTRWLS